MKSRFPGPSSVALTVAVGLALGVGAPRTALASVVAAPRGHGTVGERGPTAPAQGSTVPLRTSERVQAAPDGVPSSSPDASPNDPSPNPGPPEGDATPNSTSPEGDADPSPTSPEAEKADPSSASPEGDADPNSTSPEGDADPSSTSPEGDTDPNSTSPEGDTDPNSTSSEGESTDPNSVATEGEETDSNSSPAEGEDADPSFADDEAFDDDFEDDESFDDDAFDDDEYDPLRDSPEAIESQRRIVGGAVLLGVGGLAVLGGVLMGTSDPCARPAGNSCSKPARNRAALTMALPGVGMAVAGTVLVILGRRQRARVRSGVTASRQGGGIWVRGRF